MVKDTTTETGDQSSDSFSACPILLLYCPKHDAVQQQSGSGDLIITQSKVKSQCPED